MATSTVGPAGPAGKTGPAGVAGPPGPAGPKGDTGSNVYEVSCKADKLLGPIDGVRQAITTMTETLSGLQGLCQDIKDILENSLEMQEHVHDSHLHSKTHFAEDGTDVEPGAIFTFVGPDESGMLLAEYYNCIDKDDNGLIYGRDFIISNDDVEKPMQLRSVDDTIKETGEELPTVEMTWKDYLSSLEA